MTTGSLDSFGTRTTLETPLGAADYYRLPTLTETGVADVSRLPYSIRVLLEGALRHEDGHAVRADDVRRAAGALDAAGKEFPFMPARVVLQDFTGVPSLVDLAALRSAMARLGGDPARINPRIPADLVIDHSIQVDGFGSPAALAQNTEREYERNRERYEFLRWGGAAFDGFRVIPPASGIVHQVNLEYLATVARREDGAGGAVIFPDSLVGTDSHTTMINGLGVLGWGVGGIEAEAAMLGQPLYMLIPEVVGMRLSGTLAEGVTATDLVLAVTEQLRAHGVVGRFVEFFGPGLAGLSLPDRATIANMAPEYGATMGYFPVDAITLDYLRATGRDEALVGTVEAYYRAQGLFRTDHSVEPDYATVLELDIGGVAPALAGPKRPQDRIELKDMKAAWRAAATETYGIDPDAPRAALATGGDLGNGDVAIAAITSCTNTSNPSVMLAAGLVARKAVAAGLTRKPHVKTSLAPGSRAVTDYLARSGLLPDLEALGFHVVGYGCTTCIGNSGPLPEAVADAVDAESFVMAGVLSGNRNFEGRINPRVKANYLASPPLVVAYALAGTVDLDLASEPLGTGSDGAPVFLADVWPTAAEIRDAEAMALSPETFRAAYDGVEAGDEAWQALPSGGSSLYAWDPQSTYIREPPFFQDMAPIPGPITSISGARCLVKVGDSITTDHISPAGAIPQDAPSGRYLEERGVRPRDFNSFGSRRGNDEIMTRGTFANIRLRNEMAPGTEGGFTTLLPAGTVTSIFEAAEAYRAQGIPAVVLAGKDYGMGSSRDWAAKGTNLLGVRAVIATSYERIHRSNLVGMGVLPLQYEDGQDATTLGLTGREIFSIAVDDDVAPGQSLAVKATTEDGQEIRFNARCRLDTAMDVDYYRNGGILQTVLRGFLQD